MKRRGCGELVTPHSETTTCCTGQIEVWEDEASRIKPGVLGTQLHIDIQLVDINTTCLSKEHIPFPTMPYSSDPP